MSNNEFLLGPDQYEHVGKKATLPTEDKPTYNKEVVTVAEQYLADLNMMGSFDAIELYGGR